MIHGQDWSSYQSETPSVTGLDFAVIKATEGTGYINPKMGRQAAVARTAGLVTGFYHFLHPGDPLGQAAYFVEKAVSLPGDILACDWESSSAGSPTCGEKDRFIREVKRLRPDHRVILYCNVSFWKTRDTTSYAGEGLWIADPSHPEGRPAIEAPWVIHQYSDAGGVDRNVATFSSRAEMRAWAQLPGEEAPVSADDLRKLVQADGVLRSPADAADHDTNPFWTWQSHIENTTARVRAMDRKLSALQTTGLTEAQIEAIAVKVADVLAARLDS